MASLDPMTRFTFATLVAVLALAAPASAAPTTTLPVTGAGFGPRAGMSQYGASGYAQHGWTAAGILAHYYTGTSLGTTDPNRNVRVQLTSQTASATFSGAGQAGVRKLDPATTYTVRRKGLSQVELLARGKRVATFTAPLQVASA